VALVGNPNTGKTSLFNALTGFRRHVANYPGVTVDVGRGRIRGASRPLELLDLPGTYSLAAASPDERVVCDALRGGIAGHARPAAIVVVADASNLVRNLYLTSQVLELGLPVVVALNMMDVARARGIRIDERRLSQRLGAPVVPVIATDAATVTPLARAIEAALAAGAAAGRPCGELDGASCCGWGARCCPSEDGAEIHARYQRVHHVLEGVVERAAPRGRNWTERIDALVTQRVVGTLALVSVLYGVFALLFRGAEPLMRGMEWGFARLGACAGSLLPAGFWQSLVADGVLAGVGGVLQFLPQILMLFGLLAVLEDCGYLARMAFMVDRLMRPLGLSGRAFIPLLSSFACAVPAIMGTRAIADRRERFITILIAPFMSCSARLPVYVLFAGAFVPAKAWLGGWVRLDALVMLAMYLVGIVVAIPVALLLRKTVFAGPATGFVLELPSYRWPRLRTVWQRVYLAGRSFVLRAGTIILLVNLVVWALGYFPHSPQTRAAVVQRRLAQSWDEATFRHELAGAYLRESFLGHIGHAIEPLIRPMQWDWRIGIGVVASFPAREVIVATLGTVANLGETSEQSASLRDAIRRMRRADTPAPLFTLPVALSIMVFFALCAQCAGSLTMIGRETGSWKWPVASFVGMTALAYLAAWGVSAGGRALGL
jgi:ferrous iron transport protein B